MAWKLSTYLTRNSALSRRTANGLSRLRSATSIERWAADFSEARMPANMLSKVASWPTSTLPMSLATCWTTPSIERSPTELLRPSKTLWSEMPSIAAWNSGNW